jgi:NAD(P)-dependent dehydrogenase (short-subunit alcohol dehydrogenase family)
MNKKVLITGVTGNLGKAVAEEFIRSGYDVVGLSRSMSKEPLSFENNIEFHAVDLSDETNVNDFFAQLNDRGYLFDAAVFTAGGFASGTISQTTLRDIRKQIQLNFETAFLAARPLFLQMMDKGKGRIFFIGSNAGRDASQGTSTVAYALGKSLLFHLASLLNAEAGHKDVRAYVVVPGIIDTPENRAAMPGADTADWVKPETIASRIAQVCAVPSQNAHSMVLSF